VKRGECAGARNNQYSCMSWSQPRNPPSLLGIISGATMPLLTQAFTAHRTNTRVCGTVPHPVGDTGVPPGRKRRRCTCTQDGFRSFSCAIISRFGAAVPASVATTSLTETRVSLVAHRDGNSASCGNCQGARL
jgi:hypothetical protein